MPVLTQAQQEKVLYALGYSDYGIDQELLWLAEARAQWVIDGVQRILNKLAELDGLLYDERLSDKPKPRHLKRVDDIEYYRAAGELNFRQAASQCLQDLSRLIGLTIHYDRYSDGLSGPSKVANYGCGPVGRLY